MHLVHDDGGEDVVHFFRKLLILLDLFRSVLFDSELFSSLFFLLSLELLLSLSLFGFLFFVLNRIFTMSSQEFIELGSLGTYIKPFANWIWAGSIIMALGGCLSLSDRRHRVAAGARRRAAKAVPAE